MVARPPVSSYRHLTSPATVTSRVPSGFSMSWTTSTAFKTSSTFSRSHGSTRTRLTSGPPRTARSPAPPAGNCSPAALLRACRPSQPGSGGRDRQKWQRLLVRWSATPLGPTVTGPMFRGCRWGPGYSPRPCSSRLRRRPRTSRRSRSSRDPCRVGGMHDCGAQLSRRRAGVISGRPTP